ncbi:MAG: SIMPL domain-containing protein [Rubritepida sp.]|nr:SIMPL domain-containing protein [Rubritepida sp.]
MRTPILRRGALALLLLLAPAAALAQAPEETRLSLGASGEVRVVPDELVARLGVEVRADNAAAAQAEVNRRMAAALAAARAVEGDWTQPDPQRRDAVARQGLVLRAASGERLLALVAQLQAAGLLLEGLSWQLSPGALAAARDSAVAAAIRNLRERAGFIARELDLRVVALTRLAVDAAPDPRPMAMAAPMAARAAAAPPPAVTAEEIPLAAQVTGDFLLRR